MKHEEAAPLLPDLENGTLTSPLREELESHVDGCDECKSLHRAYRAVRAALHAELPRRPQHPSADEIVAYAVGRDRLDKETANRIEEHLIGCNSCGEEVRRTHRVDASLTPRAFDSAGKPAARFERFGGSGWLALAAAIVIAVLLYPAYLGTFRISALRDETAALRDTTARLEADARDLRLSLESVRATASRLAGWSGSLDLNLLSSALRETRERPSVALPEAKPYVAFGVEIEVPEELSATETLLFTFTRLDEGIVSEIPLPARAARSAIRSAGVVTLVVPTEKLLAGLYRLDVTRPEHPESRRLLRTEFEVVHSLAE